MPLLILADHLPDSMVMFFQPLSQGRPDVKTDRTKNMSFRELFIALGKNLLVKIVVMITGWFSGNQAREGIRSWRFRPIKKHAQETQRDFTSSHPRVLRQ